MERLDYLVIMLGSVALAAFGFYMLMTSRGMPMEYYGVVNSIGTIITVTASIIAIFCVLRFITYKPPERPYVPPLRPVQIPPAYLIYAAMRSGRRPEEFMVRGGE
ncbi:MAG: hypothetical protein QW692_00080 [Nitrososphaerota archaeon]